MECLVKYLKVIAATLKIESHNEYTKSWSKGYLKGYNQAIIDVEKYTKSKCGSRDHPSKYSL